MPIHLYIEHLLNIRTLSIQASLPTSSTHKTNATISADKSILTLTHEEETASIQLPLNLSPNKESKISLGIPPVPQKELSFRVQLEEKDDALLTNGQDRDSGIVNPWTADQLNSETEVCCKACGAAIVKRGKIQQWKDLPSDGWAEMMDFWHCHKPDHPDGPHAHGMYGEMKKGYAAGSKLALEAGVGMVDALNFVFTADDCGKIKTFQQPETITKLLCSDPDCAFILGSVDTETDGYKLRKPALSLSIGVYKSNKSFERSRWLSLRILTAVESQGVRKFSIPLSNSMVRLWVFTPDLLISTSALETNEPIRVAKILWREERGVEEREDLAGKLSRQALSEGDLSLADEEANRLVELLRESSAWLPASARKFGEWEVGLLERFSKKDVES